jgi:uncharacterized protein YjdB
MRSALLVLVVGLMSVGLGCAGKSSTNASNGPVLMSLALTAPSANIIVNQTEQITASGAYSDHTTRDLTNAVTWNSSNTGLATAAPGGLLTAKSSGTVTITATMNSVTGSFNLTIAPALVSIAVTPANQTIAAQTAQQFIATGTYTDNSKQNITSSVDWSSSNSAIATISDVSPTKGLSHGVAAGTVTITATSGSISATASLTVTSATSTSLAISPLNASLPLDVSQQYTATATFSDGTTQDVTNVAGWGSSSSSVASITVSGLATAKNLGTTNISATFQSSSASTPLTVNASDLSSISIQPGNGSIAQGTKIQFTATGTFTDGSTHNLTTKVSWSSSNPAFASISSTGAVSGISPGLVTITASLGSVTASVPFNVTNATIVSISVTPTAQNVPIGWGVQFTATGVFSDSSTQDITSTSKWASDNTAVASIGASSGAASAISTGTANINVTFSYAGASATGTTSLTVYSATLSSISITPSSDLLAPGSTLQINARGTWSDGRSQLVNQKVSWSSSSSSVASVSATGVATGQSAGVATITAQSGTLSATANLVVEGSALASIKVTPQNSSLPKTIETQLKATGIFTDGQSLDLTEAASWSSSSPSVATVSNAMDTAGLATGVAPGSTTITAVFAGQGGTATLTVTNATLNTITVSPANPIISLGTSQQFVAQGTFSDGSVLPVTLEAAWSSSDVAVATIRPNGLATSASAGTSTIQANLNGVSGSTVLTVH